LNQNKKTAKIPWHRVINSKGIISIINPIVTPKLQAKLLKKEDIKIELKNNTYQIDLKKYLWHPEK